LEALLQPLVGGFVYLRPADQNARQHQ